jgi:hypothetical protein
MSKYGSGRKYANAIAERLEIAPDLFVSAMKEASMPLTAFDKLNEDYAQLDHVTKVVGNKAVAGLYFLQQLGDTPEIAEAIRKLEARGFSKDRA